jgi:hypothetical protein
MKKVPALMIALAAFTFSAYSQNTGEQDSLETARRARENPPVLKEPKLNEITVGRISYDGIFIQVAKADNPLQLINPLAGPQYGNAEDNLVRDPVTERPSGLKFFSVSF